MRKNILWLSVLVLLGIVGVGAANVSASNGTKPEQFVPQNGRTFAIVNEATGDIENDLATYAQELRAQGFSEEEIRQNLTHLRSALERSKYGVVETRTFSVVVNGLDTDAYARALEAQGLSPEAVQTLTDAFRKHTAALAKEAPAAGGCKTRTDGAEARNAFGQALYRYSSSIYWCYDGGRITALDDWEAHSAYWGWQFRRSAGNQNGGAGQSSDALHRSAVMYQPVLGIKAHPDTRQRVYGNGSSWGNASP